MRVPPWTRLVGLLLLPAASCVAPAYAPPPPEEPTQVYLLLEGEHTGIVLPDGPRHWVEYSYADWGWVVEGEDDTGYAMYSLMNPTRGALGRRSIEGPPMLDPVYRRRGSSFQPFLAERARVEALRAELDREYGRDGVDPFHNVGFDLHYVPAWRDYMLEYHCAHATMDWLDALGCRTKPDGILRSVKMKGVAELSAFEAQSAAASDRLAGPEE